ncbi:hypothetical protein GALL_542690 [mine drainage metagenome]|uniref:Uncharacterized protein n=1 Tax=mine drainage metagenome TaxID=410659 RepID=A0A1J5PKX4_9ZZZZ
MTIANGGQQCAGGDGANAGHGHQATAAFVGLGGLFEVAVVLGNPPIQFSHVAE